MKENQEIESTSLAMQKPVMNVRELSEYTGWSMSTIYKLTSLRKIPHSCPNGKTLFFETRLINAYLISNPRKSLEAISKEALNFTLNQKWNGGQRG